MSIRQSWAARQRAKNRFHHGVDTADSALAQAVFEARSPGMAELRQKWQEEAAESAAEQPAPTMAELQAAAPKQRELFERMRKQMEQFAKEKNS